jgi:hypothetical protein
LGRHAAEGDLREAKRDRKEVGGGFEWEFEFEMAEICRTSRYELRDRTGTDTRGKGRKRNGVRRQTHFENWEAGEG